MRAAGYNRGMKGVRQMREHIEAVQRMQDYIAGHLTETITLADLARVSHFSPWYAHRLFTELLGLGPAEYIRKLRLSQSALLLRDGQCTITEAALSLGFGSVDGYQRAFLREFGCNPSAYAAHPVPLFWFTPYGVKYKQTERSVRQMTEVRSVFVQVVDKPARQVIIKRGKTATDYFTYGEEVGCEIWGLLQSMAAKGGEPVCLWLPAAYQKPGTSAYVQGVEMPADYADSVPDGLESLALPPAKYLMFQGEPFAEEDYCQAIEDVQAAIGKYDPLTIGCQWDESQPRIQLEPIGTRGYIELWPIREK